MDIATIKDGKIQSIAKGVELGPVWRKLMEGDGYEFQELEGNLKDAELDTLVIDGDGKVIEDPALKADKDKTKRISDLKAKRIKDLPSVEEFLLAFLALKRGDVNVMDSTLDKIQAALDNNPIDPEE